ncbi:uncharacterized protein [Lolium perenne]|uniref:uncharacterized protein n=1 Tax=Lolium perenne TaxID=4522 RepID=UPI0021F5AA17|nr:uncharacterized protein LOC127302284 [Lolium perenne]
MMPIPGVLVQSLAERKVSPCYQDDASQTGSPIPEDIWHHICSFLPMKDVARAARVSHVFLRAWRCHPNLTFSKTIMGLSKESRGQGKITRDYNNKIGHILKNHGGIGVKILNLEFYGPYNLKTSHCLDSWLQIALTPGIEELTLTLYPKRKQTLEEENYNLPLSLLSNGSGNSIRALNFLGCAFRPTVDLGCMRSLTSLSLCFVHITGDELGFLLSNSISLEILNLSCCVEIIFIKIPCLLKHLSHLTVSDCYVLQVIESKAPNISSFTFDFKDRNVDLLLGESLQVKEIEICHPCVLRDARTMLPSSTPNLQTLTICSIDEESSTPMLPSKFLHLKYLVITVMECAFPAHYDLFSLVSFLDASPCLETFDLDVRMILHEHDMNVEDLSQLEGIPGHRYGNLRRVRITGFCFRKSLVMLTCHILENTPSLECITLDTCGGTACSGDEVGS